LRERPPFKLMDTVLLEQRERPTIALPADHMVFLSDFRRRRGDEDRVPRVIGDPCSLWGLRS
jgi:hypothetical protein